MYTAIDIIICIFLDLIYKIVYKSGKDTIMKISNNPYITDSNKYNILSYNVKLLLASTTRNRIHLLITTILNSDYDIICFQELFCEYARQQIYEAFKYKYRYCVIKAGREQFLSEDSGLAVFSKHFIQQSGFTPYKTGFGTDMLANKGFLTCKLIINDNKYILINTHLQSSYDYLEPSYWKCIRNNQLGQIYKYINLNKNSRFIMCGDFNTSREEYKRMKFYLYKKYNIYNTNPHNKYLSTFISPHATKYDIFDHIYVSNGIKSSGWHTKKYIVDGSSISDHYAICCKLKL